MAQDQRNRFTTNTDSSSMKKDFKSVWLRQPHQMPLPSWPQSPLNEFTTTPKPHSPCREYADTLSCSKLWGPNLHAHLSPLRFYFLNARMSSLSSFRPYTHTFKFPVPSAQWVCLPWARQAHTQVLARSGYQQGIFRLSGVSQHILAAKQARINTQSHTQTDNCFTQTKILLQAYIDYQ